MVMTYKIRQSEKWSAYSRVHRGEREALCSYQQDFFLRIFNRKKKRIIREISCKLSRLLQVINRRDSRDLSKFTVNVKLIRSTVHFILSRVKILLIETIRE